MRSSTRNDSQGPRNHVRNHGNASGSRWLVQPELCRSLGSDGRRHRCRSRRHRRGYRHRPPRRPGDGRDGSPARDRQPDPDGRADSGRLHRRRRAVRRRRHPAHLAQVHVVGLPRGSGPGRSHDLLSFRQPSMRALILSAAALLLRASPLAAQEPGHDAPAGLLDVNAGLMFWTLLIFIALMFILSRYAFGPITAAVEERERALEEAILAAKADREAASALLEQQRQQIEAARNDAQRLIADGRASGEKLRAEMLEETRQQQQELLDRARREIGAERDRAIQQLRSEAVDLAIAGASRVIEKDLDDASNRQLVEKFLVSLDKAPRDAR